MFYRYKNKIKTKTEIKTKSVLHNLKNNNLIRYFRYNLLARQKEI